MNLDDYVDVPTRLKLALERWPDLRLQELGYRLEQFADTPTIVCEVRIYRTPDDPYPAIANTFQNPESIFDEVSILVNPLTSAQEELLATFDVGTVVTVTKTFTTGSPTSVTKNAVVEGIQHTITPSRHDIRLKLGQIDILLPFILNTSNLDDTTYALA